ncbi:ribonuclease H-like protein [Aspergillus avenaceus]|uniref:Ribonuclease H-like protein n=1 Tax=Aspergillus avenaceus TaxID=36643 RepID=A0A5N6U2B9_ASPAV|nr:ribonuclease H-like protein [Aspergillus avenaceus]
MLEHIKATTDTPTIITTQSNNPAQTTPKYWSHRLPKTPNITVHYCKTLASTEEIAQKFLQDKVLGLDLEWKANAPASDGILSNVSMIQLANESRIALFHLALFKPARGRQHLVSPTLKRIIESPDITKVGVSIKADCTRLRKFLNIHARAIFELSHLYRLVKYCRSEPKNVNKRLVSLTQQVEEYFGLPLAKDEDVRCGDWTTSLAYSQVHYAAADPYACYRLFHAMNEKRLALEPVPPLPAHAELDLPIRIVCENPVVESDVKIETHVSRGDRALD